MSNTTPGPEDEDRVHEPDPSVETQDASVGGVSEPEADAAGSAAEIDEPHEPGFVAEPGDDVPVAPAEPVVPAAEPIASDEPIVSTESVEPAVPEAAAVPVTAEETIVTPVYVTAPTPPKAKGNRAAGILIAVLAAVAYAIVYAAVSLGWFALNPGGHDAMDTFQDYVVSWAFWIPVVAFFLAFALLIAIVNRGGWWAYVLGGFVVAVIVYFAYFGGALLQVQAWTLTVEQANRLIAQLWTNPLTLGAAIVAREAVIWFGTWIAARGKRVRQRNLDAQRDFDREVAQGPVAHGSAASASWASR